MTIHSPLLHFYNSLFQWHALHILAHAIPYPRFGIDCLNGPLNPSLPAQRSLCRLARVEYDSQLVPHARTDKHATSQQTSDSRIVLLNGCTASDTP